MSASNDKPPPQVREKFLRRYLCVLLPKGAFGSFLRAEPLRGSGEDARDA